MNESVQAVRRIERVPAELVQAMRTFTSATVHEAYGGKGAVHHRVKPIQPAMKVCGPAVTVQARPGDNLIVHKALYVADPGDVLLVDTSSYLEAGIWGEIMTEAAIKLGLEGLVTDGSVRDSLQIGQLGFPVFSQGLSIKGTTKSCLGTINHPLDFAGVRVNPGDLVLGDADGVVIVAREDAALVHEKAEQREKKEQRITDQLGSGVTTLEIYGFSKILEDRGLTEE